MRKKERNGIETKSRRSSSSSSKRRSRKKTKGDVDGSRRMKWKDTFPELSQMNID